jgi:hypothetical protein
MCKTLHTSYQRLANSPLLHLTSPGLVNAKNQMQETRCSALFLVQRGRNALFLVRPIGRNPVISAENRQLGVTHA